MRKVLWVKDWLILTFLLTIAFISYAQPTWQVQSDYFGERNAIAQPRTIRGMALAADGNSVYTGLIQSPNTGSTSLRKVKSTILAVPGTDHVIFGNGMPGGTGTFGQVGGQPVYAGGATATFEAWRDVGNSPEGIATDDRGYVYVALSSGITPANVVAIYDANLTTQVSQITLPSPTGVDIYKTGSLYYAYTVSNAGIQRWNVTSFPAIPDLTWVSPLVVPPATSGRNLIVDNDGTVFVAGNNQVNRLAANGTVTHTLSLPNAADVAIYANKLYVIKRQSPTQPIVVLNKVDLTSAGPDLVVPAFGATRGDISQFTSIDVNAQGQLYVSEENYTGATSGGNSGAVTSYVPPVTSFNPTPGTITGRIYFDRVLVSSPVETDTDGDGIIDPDDNCPTIPNPSQVDTDSDGLGDECDGDDDNDGVADGSDNCPLVPNASQVDTDSDGLGDACDSDDDGDGVNDGLDNCPLVGNPSQLDTDGDGLGDACDSDDDGDGIADGVDNCPLISNAGQTDTDGDGVGDACDGDDDGDGTPDAYDCEPSNNKNNKWLVCHNGNTICIAQSGVATHVEHGDNLGPCPTPPITRLTNSSDTEIQPDKFTMANYPNPFNKTTRIQYFVPVDARVSIRVYDLMGKEIGVLFNGNRTAGAYSIDYNTSNLSTGVYYCRMIATSGGKEFTQTQKLIRAE